MFNDGPVHYGSPQRLREENATVLKTYLALLSLATCILRYPTRIYTAVSCLSSCPRVKGPLVGLPKSCIHGFSC